MTRVDLHPEDLFDHLRHGALRPEEHERLQRHCAQCSACAFELSLVEAQAHVEPTADDHALAARALAQLLPTGAEAATSLAHAGETAVSTRAHAGSVNTEAAASAIEADAFMARRAAARARSSALMRAAALLIAGVLVGGSMSAAALAGGSPFAFVALLTAWVAPPAEVAASPSTDTEERTRRPRRHKPTPTATVNAPIATHTPNPIENTTAADAALAPAPVLADATAVADVARAVPVPRVSANVPRASTPAATASTPTVVPAATPDPATWLFRAASRARSAGRYQEAVALYGVLQRDYAGTEAEVVARVALGRLWLGQLHDANAALAAFEGYLSARPHGPLAEEARGGRLHALQQLGRTQAAERARQELLQLHPGTLYAKSVTIEP